MTTAEILNEMHKYFHAQARQYAGRQDLYGLAKFTAYADADSVVLSHAEAAGLTDRRDSAERLEGVRDRSSFPSKI